MNQTAQSHVIPRPAPASSADAHASALFSLNLAQTIALGSRLALAKPRAAKTLKRVLDGFAARDLIRAGLADSGLTVPPLMIVSLTRQCNLSCAGCYAGTASCGTGREMDAAAFRSLLSEAENLGVTTVMLAGGEPLLRRDLLDVAAECKSTLFVVFTNGTRCDDSAVGFFRNNPHIVPVLSLEGDEAKTDARRGEGTHAAVMRAMRSLKTAGCIFGASITVTMDNLGVAISDAFLSEMAAQGTDVIFHVEYVPQQEDDLPLALDARAKAYLSGLQDRLMRRHHMPVIAFPGDETAYGGCLAAGRGFLHVGADGSLTACPFSDVSDTNALAAGLREALNSPLLRAIREHHGELSETRGGCALAGRRADVAAWLADGTCG